MRNDLLKLLSNSCEGDFNGDQVINEVFFDCDKPKGTSHKRFEQKLDTLMTEFGRDMFEFKPNETGAFVWVKLSLFEKLCIALEDVGFEQRDLELAQMHLDNANERERTEREEEQARLDALRPNALATQQLLRGVHGEFAEHLTRAFLSADSENQVKLLNEFAEVFRQANKFEAA